MATVALALTVLLSGCLRADYGYELRPDGSGIVELELRFAEELVSTLEQLGLEDIATGDLGLVEQQLDRLPEDWQERIDVEPVDDGAGVRVRIEVDDLAQLDELRQLGEIGIPQVTRRDDTWRVEVDFSDLVGAAEALAPAADELTAGDLGSLLSDALGALAGEPEVLVRVTMPGPITTADPGAAVDGDTATWTVTSGSSGVGFVESNSSPVGFLSTTLGGAPVWGLGLLGLVVAAAVVAVVVARRRRSATRRAAGGPAAAVPAAPPWESPGPAWPAAGPPGGGAPLGGWTPTGAGPVTASLSVPDSITGPITGQATGPIPASPSEAATETLPVVPSAGWHPDPWGQAAWRWWDGAAWTEHTA